MAGSIQKRGNKYLLTVSSGTGVGGKRVRHTKTVDAKNEKEAQKLLDKFIQEVEEGKVKDGAKTPFKVFAEKWISEYAAANLEPKTLYRYNELLNSRIIPAIGHIKLGDLKPLHLLEFYNNLRENGIRLDVKYVAKPELISLIGNSNLSIQDLCKNASVNDRTLKSILKFSNTSRLVAEKISAAFGYKINELFMHLAEGKGLDEQTIKHHHKLISAMLNKAVKWQLININPASLIDAPKVQKKEAKSYDDEQAVALIEALETAPLKYRVMIVLTVFSALREGELMGLEWSNVNFVKNCIDIKQTSQYLPDKGVYTKERPKTNSSIRKIYLPKYVMNLLEEYKNWQDDYKKQIGDKWIGDQFGDFLFTQKYGQPMFTYTPTQWFKKFLHEKGLPPLPFHGLRHTAISILLRNGYDVVATSKFAGHSRSSTTTDIYGHSVDSSGIKAAKILDKSLTKKKGAQQKKQA